MSSGVSRLLTGERWGRGEGSETDLARNTLLKRGAVLLLVAVMLVYSALSLLRVVSNTLALSGALDFHSYWYSGHFVREGIDPYEAFFKGLEPSVPVNYLDGKIKQTGPVAEPGLIRTPANTAPLVLLLSLFAFFSWPLAKVLWMVFNIAFMLAIPLLVIKLGERYGLALNTVQKVILALAFYGLLGSRNAIGNGQTTLLVFLLMLGALLTADKNRPASGLMLGVALSKYSLALPVAALLLFQRKFRILAISLGVQVAGVLALWLITGNPPFLIVEEYIRIASTHVGFEGIQLASMFPPGSIYAILAVALLSLPVLGLLYLYIRERLKTRFTPIQRATTDFTLLTALSLYLLLAVYHGSYDSVLIILFVALLFYAANSPSVWQLNEWHKALLLPVIAGSVLLMSVPGSVLLPIFPGWIAILDNMQTVAVLLMLGMAMWLLYKALDDERRMSSVKG